MLSREFREWNYANVDLANDVTTITHVPCLVTGVFVNTVMSAHDCPIKDGSSTVFTAPASSAVGYNFSNEHGFRTTTNLIVDPDNAATGNISVFYKLLSFP